MGAALQLELTKKEREYYRISRQLATSLCRLKAVIDGEALQVA